MPAKKAAKKTAAKKAAKKATKKTAKKAATKVAKKAAKTVAPTKKAAKTPPTLEALQKAAYYNYLKRCESGAPGSPMDDWAAAMKQLGA